MSNAENLAIPGAEQDLSDRFIRGGIETMIANVDNLLDPDWTEQYGWAVNEGGFTVVACTAPTNPSDTHTVRTGADREISVNRPFVLIAEREGDARITTLMSTDGNPFSLIRSSTEAIPNMHAVSVSAAPDFVYGKAFDKTGAELAWEPSVSEVAMRWAYQFDAVLRRKLGPLKSIEQQLRVL